MGPWVPVVWTRIQWARAYLMPRVHPHDTWSDVTDVPCPYPQCPNTLRWAEAGRVPGSRSCCGPDKHQHQWLAIPATRVDDAEAPEEPMEDRFVLVFDPFSASCHKSR